MLGSAEVYEDMPAPSHRSTAALLRSLGHVLASSGMARGLGLIKGLVLAALLAPADYGVSTLVAVVVAYSQFADFGLSAAASRELSAAMGRGDPQAKVAHARHLVAFRLFAGLTAGAAALLLSFWPGADAGTRLGLRVALPAVLAAAIVASSLLRWQAEAQPRLLARGGLVQALLDTGLCVALTAGFGLRGLLVALCLSPALAGAWAIWSGGFVAPAWPPRSLLGGYLGVGLPWVLLALLEHNLIYVDHLLVVGLFGVEALGIYNVALVVSEVIRMLALTVGIVLGPLLVQRLASEGGSIEAIREITLAPVQLLAVSLPFVVPVVCFGAQAGLLAFYPRYAAVVPLLPVLLVAAQFLALNNGASLFLFAAGKQGRAAILTGVTVVLDVVVAYGLAARGLGVSAIAWASLVAYLGFAVAYLSYVSSHFKTPFAGRLAFLAGAFVPGFYLALVLWLVASWIPRPSWPDGALLSVALSWLLLCPLVFRGRKLLKRFEAIDSPATSQRAVPAEPLSPTES